MKILGFGFSARAFVFKASGFGNLGFNFRALDLGRWQAEKTSQAESMCLAKQVTHVGNGVWAYKRQRP